MNVQSALERPLVFVDIETTGGSPRFSRVLEVGALRVENGIITDSYKSLVYPEEPIPPFITEITGITEEDVVGAPVFNEIAGRLEQITAGAVFVAHNVHFDYNFLRMEFKRMGADFRPPLLCTVLLSRYLYPDYRHHKLQSLIDRFGFQTAHRHRAYDDAEVLWQFVQRIQSDFDRTTIESALNRQLQPTSERPQ